jgi:hypothetical protein
MNFTRGQKPILQCELAQQLDHLAEIAQMHQVSFVKYPKAFEGYKFIKSWGDSLHRKVIVLLFDVCKSKYLILYRKNSKTITWNSKWYREEDIDRWINIEWINFMINL